MEKEMPTMEQTVAPEQPAEPKVVFAYVVKHYEDGSVTLEDANLADTMRVTSNDMYADVEDIAKSIANRRVSNAAYEGATRALMEFLQAQQQPRQ